MITRNRVKTEEQASTCLDQTTQHLKVKLSLGKKVLIRPKGTQQPALTVCSNSHVVLAFTSDDLMGVAVTVWT